MIPNSIDSQTLSLAAQNTAVANNQANTVLNAVVVPQGKSSVFGRNFFRFKTPQSSVGSMREPSKAKAHWAKAFTYAKDQAKHSIRAQANWAKVFAATQTLVKGAFEGCLVLQKAYYLEALDPKHEYGAIQEDYFEDWIDDAAFLSSDLRENYFEFLNSKRSPLSQSDVSFSHFLNISDPHGYATDGKTPEILNYQQLKKSWAHTEAESGQPRLASGVEQFTAQESQKLFSVSIQGQQVLFSPDYRADWKQSIENRGRRSELIFVTDKEGTIYAGLKNRGIFHHSSFLSGAPVAMAGTLLISPTGELLGTSNFSGHYQATEDHCIRFLHQLRQNGVDLNNLNFGFAKVIDGDIDISQGKAADWLIANSRN